MQTSIAGLHTTTDSNEDTNRDLTTQFKVSPTIYPYPLQLGVKLKRKTKSLKPNVPTANASGTSHTSYLHLTQNVRINDSRSIDSPYP